MRYTFCCVNALVPYQHELAEADDAPVVAAEAPVPVDPDPDAGELDAAADRLCEAERPLVLAGRGAFRAGAADALGALADELGAVLGTSLPPAACSAGIRPTSGWSAASRARPCRRR